MNRSPSEKKLLDEICAPSDLKKLSNNELNHLATEVRERILDVMSHTGGHLASNLGAVEITLALHTTFDSPRDKLIFDTSHQTYTHKIITGRNAQFSTIRRYGGLSGFASPNESPHDHFYAGHAGTGLSLALGVAKARDLNEQNFYVVPHIADAPFACGLTFEALNNVPRDLKKFILLLNDNAMAISNGVGNVHHNILGSFVLPRRTKPEAKQFFALFGFEYIGPIDGHDIASLCEALEAAKKIQKPVIIHALTIKGHGMPKAIEDPITYHGVKPFDRETGVMAKNSSNQTSFPKVFGKTLVEMAECDRDIVAITPAMPRGSCLDDFMERFPNRSFDVGIAEGHAVTFAGGLAYQSGKKVMTSIYSSFFQRGFDNVFQDICLQNLPVIFALDRSGLATGDGTTHHGIYDISFMNALPHMAIAAPRDGDLLKDLLTSCFDWQVPAVIRYPNQSCSETNRERIDRPLGRGEILSKGKDLILLGLGPMAHTALQVRDLLYKHDIEATVVDPIFAKPLDASLLYRLMLDHHFFVTIEEHAVNSGFGAILNSFIMQSGSSDIQVQNFGIPDQFIEHGNYQSLLEQIGLTPEAITEQIVRRFSLHLSNLNQVVQ